MDLKMKIAIVRCYYMSACSPTAAIRLYKSENNLHNDPFDASTVRRIIAKFESEGCVGHRSSVEGRPSLQSERLDVVSAALESESSSHDLGISSTRSISRATGIPRTSVNEILRHKLKFWPYHLQLQQELLPQDFVARKEFAEWFLENMLDSLESILWSDEAYFSLQGDVHTHNAIIWAKEKPHSPLTSSLHPVKVLVWVGFTANFVLPPFFIESGTLTGQKYHDLLENHAIPSLKRCRKFSSTIFMQDGASPHIEKSVRALLQKSFGDERTISRHFPHPWPARSPDLNPCDYYLWSHLKDKVYHGHLPHTVEELKEKIKLSLEEIALQTDAFQNAVFHILDRLVIVKENGGQHVEHLL
jgi:hypothetical protein